MKRHMVERTCSFSVALVVLREDLGSLISSGLCLDMMRMVNVRKDLHKEHAFQAFQDHRIREVTYSGAG